MKKSDFKKMSVQALSRKEMREIKGGGVPWGSLVKNSFVIWLGSQVVEHWSEIKEGFKSGYKAKL